MMKEKPAQLTILIVKPANKEVYLKSIPKVIGVTVRRQEREPHEHR